MSYILSAEGTPGPIAVSGNLRDAKKAARHYLAQLKQDDYHLRMGITWGRVADDRWVAESDPTLYITRTWGG